MDGEGSPPYHIIMLEKLVSKAANAHKNSEGSSMGPDTQPPWFPEHTSDERQWGNC